MAGGGGDDGNSVLINSKGSDHPNMIYVFVSPVTPHSVSLNQHCHALAKLLLHLELLVLVNT